MAIHFNEKEKIFHIQTNNSSYVFCVAEHDALEHLYYGKQIPNDNIKYISNRQIYAHIPLSIGHLMAKHLVAQAHILTTQQIKN